MGEVHSKACTALFEHLQKESFLLPASPLPGYLSELYDKEGKFVPYIGVYKFYEHSGIINRLDHFHLRGFDAGFDVIMKITNHHHHHHRGLLDLIKECDEVNRIIFPLLNDVLVSIFERNVASVEFPDWDHINRVLVNIKDLKARLDTLMFPNADSSSQQSCQPVKDQVIALVERQESLVVILLRIVFSLHLETKGDRSCTVHGTLSEVIQDRIRMFLSYKEDAKICGVQYMKIPLYLSTFRDTQSKVEINWESIVNNEDELQRQFLDHPALKDLFERESAHISFEEVMHEVDRMQTFSMVHAMSHCIRSQEVDDMEKMLLMTEYKKVFTDQGLRSCCCCGAQVYSKSDSFVRIECKFQDIHNNQYIKVFNNTEVAAQQSLHTFNCFLQILKVSDEDKDKYLHEAGEYDCIRREYGGSMQTSLETDLHNLTRRSPRSVLCVKNRSRKDQYHYYHLHPELIYKKGCHGREYEWHEGMDSASDDPNGNGEGFGHDCASGILYDDEHVAMEMCKVCWTSLARKRKPKFSLCQVDFGCLNRLCLPRLSLIEQMVTSRARQFGIIVQLHFGSRAPSVLRSHLICFKINGPEKVVCLCPLCCVCY